jgi:hypothetical protein
MSTGDSILLAIVSVAGLLTALHLQHTDARVKTLEEANKNDSFS